MTLPIHPTVCPPAGVIIVAHREAADKQQRLVAGAPTEETKRISCPGWEQYRRSEIKPYN